MANSIGVVKFPYSTLIRCKQPKTQPEDHAKNQENLHSSLL